MGALLGQFLRRLVYYVVAVPLWKKLFAWLGEWVKQGVERRRRTFEGR